MIKTAILLSIIYYAFLFYYQRNHKKKSGLMEQSNAYNIIASMDSIANALEKNTPVSEGAIETNEVPVLKIEKKVQELKDKKTNEVMESVKKEEEEKTVTEFKEENEEKSSLLKENVKENMEYLYKAQNIDLTQEAHVTAQKIQKHKSG